MNNLILLGSRLKSERLRKNETQKTFAARVGVSVPTLNKMEKGEPTVSIGHWSSALRMLGREGDLVLILAPPNDLFKRYDEQQNPERKRASRKKP